jgi:hypothetical protein
MNNKYNEINDKINNNLKINQAELNRASENGDLKLAELIVKSKYIHPEAEGNIAILYAYYNNHYEVCKLLMSFEKVKKSLQEDHEEAYDKINKFLKLSNF